MSRVMVTIDKSRSIHALGPDPEVTLKHSIDKPSE